MAEPMMSLRAYEYRSAEPFPAGAPSVALTGIQVYQAVIQQSLPSDEKPSEKQALNVHVYCMPRESAPVSSDDALSPFTLIIDLQVTRKSWFLGVTAASGLRFRDHDDIPSYDADGANSIVATLGSWAGHVLYDHIAVTARTLVASVPQCMIEIPSITPPIHLATVEQRSVGGAAR